jgi:two-component sensor histidine kinase
MSGDIAQAKSLGLRLVRTLAEQLSAKLEFSSPPGTAVKLTFPLPD